MLRAVSATCSQRNRPPDPVGLQHRGEGYTGGSAPPPVLSGFRGCGSGDAAKAAQDGLDVHDAGSAEALALDDAVLIGRDRCLDSGRQLVGKLVGALK